MFALSNKPKVAPMIKKTPCSRVITCAGDIMAHVLHAKSRVACLFVPVSNISRPTNE